MISNVTIEPDPSHSIDWNMLIRHLEVRNEELQVSRKEWVDKAQASEKECQRLFEENERIQKQNDEMIKKIDWLSARSLTLTEEYEKLEKAYDACHELWKERDKEFDELRAECFRLKGLIQTQGADKE